MRPRGSIAVRRRGAAEPRRGVAARRGLGDMGALQGRRSTGGFEGADRRGFRRGVTPWGRAASGERGSSVTRRVRSCGLQGLRRQSDWLSDSSLRIHGLRRYEGWRISLDERIVGSIEAQTGSSVLRRSSAPLRALVHLGHRREAGTCGCACGALPRKARCADGKRAGRWGAPGGGAPRFIHERVPPCTRPTRSAGREQAHPHSKGLLVGADGQHVDADGP